MRRKWIFVVGVLAVLVLAAVLFGFGKKAGPILQIAKGSAVAPYVSEFRRAGDGDYGLDPLTAGDGSASVTVQEHETPVLGRTGCHTVWLNLAPARRRTEVISLYEADPGSGTSFAMSWSKDSRALFIWGGHSGLGCNSSKPVAFGLIYTLKNEKLWNVGPRPEDEAIYRVDES